MPVTSSGENPTYLPYEAQEAERLREGLRAGENPLPCPRCGQLLAPGNPIGGGTMAMYWFLRCEPCKRAITVRDSVP